MKRQIKCIACNKHLKKETYFSKKCLNCNLYISNLKNGYGAPIQGIDEIRKINFLKIINYIETQNIKKILEIGPGSGLFLKMINKKKINICAIEPGEKEYKKLKKNKFKIMHKAFPCRIKKFKKKFDLIIFNDVFEHLRIDKIKESIKLIDEFLSQNGKLILNLPNSDGIFFKFAQYFRIINIDFFYKRLWQYDSSSPHTAYYNKKNIIMLIEKNGNLFYNNSIPSQSIAFNNKKRIKYSIKNPILFFLINTIIKIFYFPIIKLMPQDTQILIFQKND